MNTKSLSPKVKPTIRKAKIILKKLGSLQKLLPSKPNFSINRLHSPDSQVSLISSHINSKIHSSSRINLKLANESSIQSFPSTSQHKLKAIAEKFSPVKSAKSLTKNLGEHLLPMACDKAILTFSSILNKFEQNELQDYSDVYYLGLRAKKHLSSEKLKPKAYDDKNTDYIINPGDHIAYRYEILELLGSGSFSQVCKCFDHKAKKEVALKIIKSHKRFEEQGQIEVKVLRYLKNIESSSKQFFVQMEEHFFFRGHLCITFELLGFNLYELLKANRYQGFSSTLVRRFAIQILKGLSLLRGHEIVHCDLKPENIILVNSLESSLKIIDFGSSCFENERIYYYIQSRIYRAPEVILGIPYTAAIDMWSLGCIIVELLTGDPMFQGENEAEQLLAIMEVLGYPPECMIKVCSKKSKFFTADFSIKPTLKSKAWVPGSISLGTKSKSEDPAFIDFLSRNFHVVCLEWNPNTRLTPEAALLHPWIKDCKKTSLYRASKPPISPRLKLH